MSIAGGEPTPSGREGDDMNSNEPLKARSGTAAIAATARELAALDQMSVGELAEKYLEVVGRPTRTRNKQYLRKRLAWHIQERTEGGLSVRALERIEKIAPEAPVRWRQPLPQQDAGGESRGQTAASGAARDPRLPPAGTTLTRIHDGVEHKVTVLETGFEYGGQCYRSLSKIARIITGTPWNGFLFFLPRTQGTKGTEEIAE
jgi:DUF2924 family protein